MKLGKFTALGIQRFNDFLGAVKNGSTMEFPKDLFTYPGYFVVMDEESDLIPHKFKTRLDAGKYLYSLLSNSNVIDAERDAYMWAYLTAAYFDELCPVGPDGKRKIRERAAYIPEPENYKRYYRHLLLGPYLIYKTHIDNPTRALALLCKPPYTITDIEGQIAAKQELITNPSVVELVTKLYYDPATKTTKPGAGGKGLGSPRRLVTILDQFSLTWDLYAASTDEILNLLPKEFGKFVKN